MGAAVELEQLLEPMRSCPGQSAVVCDIDGTLAPIVARPEDAAVPARGRRALEALAGRYALVACVSGRRALEARRIAGVDSLTFVGNHGLETLAPGAAQPTIEPAATDAAERVRSFAAEAFTSELRELGVTLEDKLAIWAFHYRRAADEDRARAALDDIARRATAAGLVTHWGRKVLEIRPALAFDKGTAVGALLRRAPVSRALFAGDDTTDLDAFRKLDQLREHGALEHAVRVGVRSPEGPAEIVGEADLVVDGPAEFIELLERLLR